MAADTVKSASITSLDAAAQSLSAPLTEGIGAPGRWSIIPTMSP
jgi:hypothetical protein